MSRDIGDWSAAPLLRRLEADGFQNIVTRSRAELDLANTDAVSKFLAAEKPVVVLLAAAKVGGIKANNDFPVEFLLENVRIQNNVIRPLMRMACANYCSSAVPAFIRSMRLSRFRKVPC